MSGLGCHPRGADPSHATADSPSGEYEAHAASGFTVLVSREVRAHPDEHRGVVATVDAALAEASRLFGEERVARIRRVRIWIEWEVPNPQHRQRGPAEFHVSRAWLTANGYDGDKENGIEINDTRLFLRAMTTDQPSYLVHELAHAYQQLVLGDIAGEIDAVFEQARASHRYDAVRRVNRPEKVRAYALTNAREYFAETTECYLGTNESFPFVREQLREVDPPGYTLMERVWGAGPPRPSAPLGPCADNAASPHGGVSSALVLTNETRRSLEIAWLDRSGARANVWRLEPDATRAMQVFEGHVFSATEADTGRCVGHFVGPARPATVTFVP
jgi:hypothetical protein